MAYLAEKNSSVISIKLDDHIVEKNEEILDMFNKFFSTVYTNDKRFMLYDGNSQLPLYSMKRIIIPEVVVSMAGLFDCLLRLYAKRSCGMDEMPKICLRRYAKWYSKFFYVIYTCSPDAGVVPNEWKNAWVVPV